MTSPHEYLGEAWIKDWETRNAPKEKFAFEPENAALLLIDLQNYFIHPDGKAFIAPSGRILPKLLALAGAWRARDLPLVLTRHVDDGVKHPLMVRWWEGALLGDDPDSRLIPELEPFLESSILIQKHWYDPFRKTGLAQILKGRGVNQVVIGGVMAHLCCETAARSAFAYDFLPFFLLDGTASDHSENHEATLLNLAHGFAVLTTCAQIRSRL